MKKLSYIIFSMLLIAAFSSCHYGTNFSYSGDGDDAKANIRISNETGDLRLESRGQISFTDEEDGIKSLSPGGYIRIKRNGRILKVANNPAGQIVYETDHGSHMLTLNADDKKFLRIVIKQLIDIGFDAKGRAQRLYDKGGSPAVLNAIEDLTNDYVKGIYFDYLLSTPSLTQAELTTIARKIATFMSSDYEKGKLLKKFSGDYLQNDETAAAYLDAVNTINSDYEKSQALQNILNQQLTQQQYTQVLNITGGLGSDYEKANVLKQLISHGIPETTNLNKFIDVTANISSDYEKSNVLQKLIDEGVPSQPGFTTLMFATGNLNSDFEKANVIKKVAGKNISDEDQWISLINETEKIGGDYDRSSTLVEIAKKMPNSDRVKTAYMATAKTITSEYDYGQAIKAAK